jgi:hypothetical protein
MMILVTVEVQILQHCPDSLEHSPATANFAGEKLKFLHCKLHRSFITRFGISVNCHWMYRQQHRKWTCFALSLAIPVAKRKHSIVAF